MIMKTNKNQYSLNFMALPHSYSGGSWFDPRRAHIKKSESESVREHSDAHSYSRLKTDLLSWNLFSLIKITIN
jgi:hypothetical protein